MQIQLDAAAFERDLRRAAGVELERVERAIDDSVREATVGLKEELRDRTFIVLGRRVAYAWQGRFYQNKGAPQGPAGFVWSKAPKILDFFTAEKIVTPIGRAFAIPVNPVVKRFGRAMTIPEVEARFNQDLIPRRLKSGNIGLFANLVAARSGRGFRAPTKGRLAQGRKPELTLMFVLVDHLQSRRLVDLQGPALRWGDKVAEMVVRKLNI